MSSKNTKTVVKEKYGAAATRAASGLGSSCCGTSPASSIEGCDPITSVRKRIHLLQQPAAVRFVPLPQTVDAVPCRLGF